MFGTGQANSYVTSADWHQRAVIIKFAFAADKVVNLLLVLVGVTAIKLPVGIDFPSLDRGMQQKFSVSLGTSLESLNGKIFRIGHMGALDLLDVYAILGAVEMQLRSLGVSIPFGTSAAKFQELLSQSK